MSGSGVGVVGGHSRLKENNCTGNPAPWLSLSVPFHLSSWAKSQGSCTAMESEALNPRENSGFMPGYRARWAVGQPPFP